MSISGPPSTLKSLSKTSLLANSSPQPHINGPYHAPHLYSSFSVEELLELTRQSVVDLLRRYTARIPWLSTSSAHWVEPEIPTEDLLKHAVNDILCRTSQSANVLKACKNLVSVSSPARCDILIVGPTGHEPDLIPVLREVKHLEIKIHERPSRESSLIRMNQVPRTARKSKLAIVGMAGRFPDSASHEKLWELLEAGLDVHREVCIRKRLKCLFTIDNRNRYQKIASISKNIMIRVARSEIQAIPRTDASLRNQVFSILDFLICPPGRHYKRIRCTDLV